MLVNIEAERARLQMSKMEMCKALGVTLKTYNLWLRTENMPADKLRKLRKMTGKSIDYLLGLESTGSTAAAN